MGIIQYKDKLDWHDISKYQKLSKNFIRKFKDKVYWQAISQFQEMDEDFIREFKDRVYWYRIFHFQKIIFSKKFLLEFYSKYKYIKKPIKRYLIGKITGIPFEI